MHLKTLIAVAAGTAGLTAGGVVASPHLASSLTGTNLTRAVVLATSRGGTSNASSRQAMPATAPRQCDLGSWQGPSGINVEGRPDNLNPGDSGAVYIWHARNGWHLRTTDKTSSTHVYSGTLRLSAGSQFVGVTPIRLEKDDHIQINGDGSLSYSFATHNGIDGLNFRVAGCNGPAAAATHETLSFSLDYNGHEDVPSRIRLGDKKQQPASASFTATRNP